ncbi:MAG: 2-phospho-L-lactate transferase [Nitrospinota bacterium]
MNDVIVALAGGVGGAKLVLGLAHARPPEEVTAIVNTADDLTLYGLHVSPDLDTVMYTLAGLADPVRGWGVASDTTHALDMLEHYGHPAWFRLGDRDLGTHLLRRELLDRGKTLTEVTAILCRALGVRSAVLPMTDDPVRTRVLTPEGELEFQDYFVGRKAGVRVTGLRFAGIEKARPSGRVLEAIGRARAVVFCPSNPFVSLGPILALPGLAEAIRSSPGPKAAVSPILGGRALKGPAAKMMKELGEEPSASAVARRYVDLLDAFVLDEVDRSDAETVERMGLRVLVTNTVMNTLEDKTRLGREVLEFLAEIARAGGRSSPSSAPAGRGPASG